MRDDPAVVALVSGAAKGDEGAWDELVERYAPMVWSICTRYRLSRHDAEDVGQTVWLRLVEQLEFLREPAALPGWLATTTQRECIRVLRGARRHDRAALPEELPGDPDAAVVEEEIIAAERNAALRAAFAELPLQCRQLLTMFLSDPPRSYAEIGAALQMPIGSIGPRRARCLRQLSRSSYLTAFISDQAVGTPLQTSGGEPHA